MPTYRHPRADPETDAAWAADLGDGTIVSVDADGLFDAESDAAVQAIANAYDTTATAMRVDGDDATDEAALIEAGECPWCDGYSGDGVPQHASSAHPDEWAAYTEAE